MPDRIRQEDPPGAALEPLDVVDIPTDPCQRRVVQMPSAGVYTRPPDGSTDQTLPEGAPGVRMSTNESRIGKLIMTARAHWFEAGH